MSNINSTDSGMEKISHDWFSIWNKYVITPAQWTSSKSRHKTVILF